ACNRFVDQRHCNVVVKVSPGQLPSLATWISKNRWDPRQVELIVSTEYVSYLYGDAFLEFVQHSLAKVPYPERWRAITLAGAAAPADDGSLKVGRNEVPRLEWLMWKRMKSDAGYHLDFGHFATIHPG